MKFLFGVEGGVALLCTVPHTCSLPPPKHQQCETDESSTTKQIGRRYPWPNY